MPPTYRFPPVSLSQQPPDLHPYAENLEQMASTSFGPDGTFVTYRDATTSGLTGPFPTLIASKQVGTHLTETFLALSTLQSIPADAREIAMLVPSVRFGARYAQYAHTLLAIKMAGLSEEQVGAVKAGRKPEGLSEAAGVVYDASWFLANERGPLPGDLYEAGVRVLGKEGMLVVAHCVGLYCYMSVLMNHSAVPVPDGEA